MQGAEDSGHVAMGARADDLEGLRKRGAEGSGALQDRAESLDLSGRPMREVGEGAVADLAVEAERFAEEEGGRARGDGRMAEKA